MKIFIILAAVIVIVAMSLAIDRPENWVFDPKVLEKVANYGIKAAHSKYGANATAEQVVGCVIKEVIKTYPQHTSYTGRWLWNNAGGAMGSMTVLHSSFSEYLIIFGTAVGTEGHTGRYHWAEDFFTVLYGEQWAALPGIGKAEVYGPGDQHYLTRRTAKQYRMPGACWALEYARGNIPSMLFFGFADTFSSTLDFVTLARTVGESAGGMINSAIQGKVYGSDRITEARRAFGDAKRSRESHDKKLEEFNVDIRENSALRNRSLVLSSFTGLVSAAGVLGAMSASQQLDGGGSFSAVLAGHLLMQTIVGGSAIAYTTCLALIFDRCVYDIELKRELWEIDNHLTGEIQEMVAIYKAQGLSEDDALMITRVFARHRASFASLMMVEELGYCRLEPPGRREAVVDAAIPAFVGYAMGCFLPFLPLLARRPRGVRVQEMGMCSLAVGGVLVSIVQSEVFYGGYASMVKTLKVIVCNIVAIGAVFAASRVTSCFFRSTK